MDECMSDFLEIWFEWIRFHKFCRSMQPFPCPEGSGKNRKESELSGRALCSVSGVLFEHKENMSRTNNKRVDLGS